MIVAIKEVTHSDNQINVLVEFSAGEHSVKEFITFYGSATLQELVALVKASAKRLYLAAQTANTFIGYVEKKYDYNFQTDTLTEIEE